MAGRTGLCRTVVPIGGSNGQCNLCQTQGIRINRRTSEFGATIIVERANGGITTGIVKWIGI